MTKGTSADPTGQGVDVIEAGLQMQSQGLALLLAEMQALVGLLPGAFAPGAGKTLTEAEAEVEAGFDNMPV